MLKYFECVKCKKKFVLSKKLLTCNHSKYYDYLECVYEGTKKTDFLPIKNPSISLGEGNTPLVKSKEIGKLLGMKNLYFKDEGKNPTGCFKDRESFVLVNKAIEFGFEEIFVISSGNAAISLSAYSNAAGIKCSCFIPQKTSIEKKKMIKTVNKNISEIKGSYEDVYRKVINSEQAGWNCTLNPYKTEGNKMIAYEIFEEIGIPDKVIVPCGNGSNLAGIWKGFAEIKMLKNTAKIPQMIGIQIKNAAPLEKAMNSKKDFAILNNVPDSIAEGIVASESYSSPKTLKAIKDSDGKIITITEDELECSINEIAKLESMDLEPTSAVVFAALKKIDSKPNEKKVVIITAKRVKGLDLQSFQPRIFKKI